MPGKRPDLLVLSADPLGGPADRIGQIQVLETWVQGRQLLVRP
jgi:predicted amidohydrolase YtcJ